MRFLFILLFCLPLFGQQYSPEKMLKTLISIKDKDIDKCLDASLKNERCVNMLNNLEVYSKRTDKWVLDHLKESLGEDIINAYKLYEECVPPFTSEGALTVKLNGGDPERFLVYQSYLNMRDRGIRNLEFLIYIYNIAPRR